MKANPEDIRGLAEDLENAISNHGDALEHNKDIGDELVRLRNKTERRYAEVTEGKYRSQIPARTDRYVP